MLLGPILMVIPAATPINPLCRITKVQSTLRTSQSPPTSTKGTYREQLLQRLNEILTPSGISESEKFTKNPTFLMSDFSYMETGFPIDSWLSMSGLDYLHKMNSKNRGFRQWYTLTNNDNSLSINVKTELGKVSNHLVRWDVPLSSLKYVFFEPFQTIDYLGPGGVFLSMNHAGRIVMYVDPPIASKLINSNGAPGYESLTTLSRPKATTTNVVVIPLASPKLSNPFQYVENGKDLKEVLQKYLSKVKPDLYIRNWKDWYGETPDQVELVNQNNLPFCAGATAIIRPPLPKEIIDAKIVFKGEPPSMDRPKGNAARAPDIVNLPAAPVEPLLNGIADRAPDIVKVDFSWKDVSSIAFSSSWREFRLLR